MIERSPDNAAILRGKLVERGHLLVEQASRMSDEQVCDYFEADVRDLVHAAEAIDEAIADAAVSEAERITREASR